MIQRTNLHGRLLEISHRADIIRELLKPGPSDDLEERIDILAADIARAVVFMLGSFPDAEESA